MARVDETSVEGTSRMAMGNLNGRWEFSNASTTRSTRDRGQQCLDKQHRLNAS